MRRFIKPIIISSLVGWALLFVITLFTIEDLELGERLLCTFIMGSLIGIGVWAAIFQEATTTNKNTKKADNARASKKILYIYKGDFGNKFEYRIENNRIYHGYDSKFIYRMEKNKIYKGLDSKPTYEIKENRVYRYLETKPLYRIEGNKVYLGNFGTKTEFRISTSKNR